MDLNSTYIMDMDMDMDFHGVKINFHGVGDPSLLPCLLPYVSDAAGRTANLAKSANRSSWHTHNHAKRL